MWNEKIEIAVEFVKKELRCNRYCYSRDLLDFDLDNDEYNEVLDILNNEYNIIEVYDTFVDDYRFIKTLGD